MNLSYLLNHFPQSTFSQNSLVQPDSEIISVLMLEPGETQLFPQYLYIGRTADLPPRIPTMEGKLSLILDSSPPEVWVNRCNIAVLRSPDRMLSVFNTLHRQLVRQQQTLIQLNQMFSSLLTHKGMQDMVERASDLLGNPLLLMEGDGKFLAWRSWLPEQAADTIRVEHLRSELAQTAMDKEHMKLLADTGIILKMSRSKTTEVYFDSYLGCTAAIAPVIIGSVEVAWLHMVEFCRPFESADLECFNILAKLLSQEMQKNDLFVRASKSSTGYFLRELLETDHPNERAIHRQLEALHFVPKHHFYLAILEFSTDHPTSISFEALENQLRGVLSGCMWCVYQEHFVILFTAEENEQFSPSAKSALRRAAITNRLMVGISNRFFSLTEIRVGYSQARSAVYFGQKFPITYNTGRPVCQYYQYAFLEMLEKCGRDYDLIQYCSPMLLRLLDYDQKNGTDLMNTLFEYLENSRNINQTADALYVHKNTLLNRLNRIRTVMDCDLNNNWDRFLLSLSFRVLAYQNIYRPDSVKQIWKQWEENQSWYK